MGWIQGLMGNLEKIRNHKKSVKQWLIILSTLPLLLKVLLNPLNFTENRNSYWTYLELGINHRNQSWFFFAWVRGAHEHVEGNDKMLELPLAQLVPHS